MRCADVMSQDVEFVSPEDSIRIAAIKMQQDNIGFLPVCEGERRVIGVLTDRDIVVRGVALGRDLDSPVRYIMSQGAITCDPNDELEYVEELMTRNQIERVLVVDDLNQLLGVISLADLAQFGDRSAVGEALRNITEREAPSPL